MTTAEMTHSERRSYMDADELRQERIEIEAAQLWREISAKPAEFASCFFETIAFTEDERAAIIAGVCAIRADSAIKTFHMQAIVNAVVVAVEKQVMDTAEGRELDDEDGWDAAMAKTDWSAPR